MSYTDTTLSVQASYTNIHQKQVYDVIAAQLGAHAAWSLVDTVDAIVSTLTYRTYVWKCSAAGSGLTADFYVAFRLNFTTSTGLWSTNSYLQVYVWETYNATTHVASKMAMVTSTTAQTLAADGSNSSTWALTADRPATAPNIPAWAGLLTTTVTTSVRMLTLVAKDAVVVFQSGGTATQAYAGAMETLLSGTDDPLPIIVGANASNQGGMVNGAQSVSSIRHPKLTGSQASVFAFSPYWSHQTLNSASTFSNQCFAAPAASAAAGTLGLSTDTAYPMFLGGPVVSKCCISSSGAGSGSTKGGLRGFFRHIAGCILTTHAFGDTFTVDGAVWAGQGITNGSLLETTAA